MKGYLPVGLLLAIAGLLSVSSVSVVRADEGSVWQGAYSTDQARVGEALFVTHCQACHSNKPGEVGGHGPAPALFGEDFEFRWLDSSVLDVLDIIRQTMPEAAPNSLSAVEYAALTAYILQLNGYPAGAASLDPQERDRLANIYIEQAP